MNTNSEICPITCLWRVQTDETLSLIIMFTKKYSDFFFWTTMTQTSTLTQVRGFQPNTPCFLLSQKHHTIQSLQQLCCHSSLQHQDLITNHGSNHGKAQWTPSFSSLRQSLRVKQPAASCSLNQFLFSTFSPGSLKSQFRAQTYHKSNKS